MTNKDSLSTPQSVLLKMVDAKQRMAALEKKYRRHPEYPHVPVVVDLIEFYPDQGLYQQAARDLWEASQQYATALCNSEAV